MPVVGLHFHCRGKSSPLRDSIRSRHTVHAGIVVSPRLRLATKTQLADQFRSQPLADLLAPSIEYADGGFPVTEVIAGYWASAEPRLAEWEDSAMTYLPNDRALRQGEMFRNPHPQPQAIARSPSTVATRSTEARLPTRSSRSASETAATSQNGISRSTRPSGLIRSPRTTAATRSGNCRRTGKALPCCRCSTFWSSSMSRRSDTTQPICHLLVGESWPSLDRLFLRGPGWHGGLPITELISKLRATAKRISFDRAATDVPPGDPKLSRGDTVYLTVVDKDRNCCSLIQSIYYGWLAGRAG